MTIQLQLTWRIQDSLKKKDLSAGWHMFNLSVLHTIDNHITIRIQLNMGKAITPPKMGKFMQLRLHRLILFSHLTPWPPLCFVVEPPKWNPDLVRILFMFESHVEGIYIRNHKITDWRFQPSKKKLQLGSSPHYPGLKIRKECLKPPTRYSSSNQPGIVAPAMFPVESLLDKKKKTILSQYTGWLILTLWQTVTYLWIKTPFKMGKSTNFGHVQ